MTEKAAYSLPKKGKSQNDILNELTQMKKNDIKWEEGKNFCLVYSLGQEIGEFIKKAHNTFISENALNPTAFPSLCQMENEIISMSSGLLGGNEKTAGSLTSGGTESILLAIKTAREWAKEYKSSIKKPEMIVPETAHPAFNKASHYFGVKIVTCKVDPKTYKADLKDLKKKINKNTILMVGSAPQYVHGVIDPIEEMGKLALEYSTLLHVDSCIGGFLLPFFKMLGIVTPSFDFSVPGVTSISADLHKYAYTAKGASVILYKNQELRKFQYFATTDWAGGIYVSPSISGTRPGGPIAAAWAMLNHLGENGYMEIAQKTYEARRKIEEGISRIQGLEVMAKPEAGIICLGSPMFNIFAIGDKLSERGWYFDRQHHPDSIHLTITHAHHKVSEKFLEDLSWATNKTQNITTSIGNLKTTLTKGIVKILPKKLVTKMATKEGSKVTSSSSSNKDTAAIYGLMGTLSKKGSLDEMAIELMDQMFTPKKKD